MKPKIGIQLYTLRDYIKTPEDFDKTLGFLKTLGVEYVQISAIGDFPAETQKEILEKHNIKVCVTHKMLDSILGETRKQIDEHKIIGCDAIGLGSAPESYRGSAKRTRELIQKINSISGMLKENGMTFNYHNHNFEFYRLDDMACSMMDILLCETDEEVFKFIPDVAWIHYAGEAPCDVLRKMKGRVKVVHFKDYIITPEKERKFVSLGQGEVDLVECYKAACELEIPYIMYEQDDCFKNGDPFESVKESWEYLKELEVRSCSSDLCS